MREPGFYWVGNNVGDWNVCEWIIESCGHSMWKDTRDEYHDSDFTEIDERRIVREGYTDLSSDEEKEKRAKELYIEIGKVLRKYGLP